MRLNLPFLKWGAHRLRTGRSADIRSVATREWILCPDEVTVIPPAIHLDGALDRVVALSPWRNWETERSLIAGGRCDHAASRAHLIEAAEISGAFVYLGGAKSRFGFGPEKVIAADSERRDSLPEAHLVSNDTGSNFFANMMIDDLPLALVPEAGAPTIALTSKAYAHEDGYRQLLSLPRPPVVRNAIVDRLTVYTDFAQNSLKAARYHELRNRMRRALPAPPHPGRPGVFIKRGGSGERRLLINEKEVERILADRGFDILDPEALSSREIAERSFGARIVAGVEGSHLFHAVYTMADGAAFLVLQPPDRFAMTHKEFTDRVDMRFAFLVCAQKGTDFAVDLDELQHLLDKLQ